MKKLCVCLSILMILVIFVSCNRNIEVIEPLESLEVTATATAEELHSTAPVSSTPEGTVQLTQKADETVKPEESSGTVPTSPTPTQNPTVAQATATPKPATPKPTATPTPTKVATPKPTQASTPTPTQNDGMIVMDDTAFINGILLGINDIKAENGYPPVASVDVEMGKGCVEHAKKMAIANTTYHSTDNFFLESCAKQALIAPPQSIGWSMVYHTGQLTECEKIGIGVVQYNNRYWVVVRGD